MHLWRVLHAATLTTLLVSSSLAASLAETQRAELKNLIIKKSLEKLSLRANAPDGQSSYAPATNQPCPFPSDHNYIRPATSISANETTYIQGRLNNAKNALSTFFANAKVAQDGLDILLENSKTIPRIAIAISGGGYRAMLHGSGGIAALDSRNSSSVAGLLQSSVYMAGLSGGSWAVTVCLACLQTLLWLMSASRSLLQT
jgi:hypothetical protein